MSVTQRKGKKQPEKSRKTAKKSAKVCQAPVTTTPKRTRVAPPPTPPEVVEPRGRGQPKFEPTEAQRQVVILGKGAGMTDVQIAALIKHPKTGKAICPKTLVAAFPDELANGKAQVMARVAGNLVTIASDKAHKNTVTAAIFYLKTQAQWREPEPAASEARRLEAETMAMVGDQKFSVTLVLEERPDHIKPQTFTAEEEAFIRG